MASLVFMPQRFNSTPIETLIRSGELQTRRMAHQPLHSHDRQMGRKRMGGLREMKAICPKCNTAFEVKTLSEPGRKSSMARRLCR